MSSHHHFKKPKLFKSKSPLKPWELTWRNQDGGWTQDTVKQEVTLRVREDVGSVLSHILSLIWTVSVFWPSGAERICEFTVKEKKKKIPRDQKTSAHINSLLQGRDTQMKCWNCSVGVISLPQLSAGSLHQSSRTSQLQCLGGAADKVPVSVWFRL